MALIKCPDCGKDVSNRAPICIYCGCPLNKDNNDTVSGFCIVSLDGNTASLQCENCKRTSDYWKNVILTSESEQEWITNTTIRCSCCGNTMGKGLKIKQEYIKHTNTKKKEEVEKQYKQTVSNYGKLKKRCFFVILIVGLVIWMLTAPKTLASGNGFKHQIGKFGKCDVNFDDCTQDATHRIQN